ncbi:MAG: zinc ribbon domain-containing protein, partial [Chloroflexi bacterium]
MFCIYCRTDNPPEAHFCARCGQWQQKELGIQTMVCISCGESNPPDASFCRNCSAQLKREMSAPTSDGTLLSSRFSDPSMRG